MQYLPRMRLGKLTFNVTVQEIFYRGHRRNFLFEIVQGGERMESRKELPEKQWETELVKRIDEMDRNNSGIKRMKKKDYIIAGIIVIVCLCSVVAGAFISGDSGNPAIEPTEEKETLTEEHETGAWEKGTLYHNDYEIILSCPEAGHPSGGTDWSISYQDETGDIDVMVDFRFQEAFTIEISKRG